MGRVIKEPDWAVNSAQRCMESTRPNDSPNRPSYCKQHAHLDSNRPRGETGESCHCLQVSSDKRGSISPKMCVHVCKSSACASQCLWICVVATETELCSHTPCSLMLGLCPHVGDADPGF